jgi:uncharacterized protein (DUF1697 family)
MTYVALLRGINVGGKNKLPMKDLVELFVDMGCRDVKSYIQSGNIIFDAPLALAKRAPKLVASQIVESFGYSVPIVVRSSQELRAVSRNNPFLKAISDTNLLHVAFLSEKPKVADVSKLDPNRSLPDQFVVRGREIYLCLPRGVAQSKLTNAYFDSNLATTCTWRNWNTLQKLIELTQ